MTTLRTFSFGAGKQSTAALVLAARGEIDYRIFLFANTGDDSEHPDTIDYFRRVHQPYAEAHGIDLLELHPLHRTLLAEITERKDGRVPIPMFLEPDLALGNRTCTRSFKMDVVHRWQRANGSSRDQPAITGLGISLDEIERMRTTSKYPTQLLDYPLVDLGLSRRDCERLVAEAGLPPAPKSACWFCPYSPRERWQTLRRQHPDLWQRAVDMEATVNERRAATGANPVRFNKKARLPDLLMDGEVPLFDPDDYEGCDTASCWT